MDQLTLLYIALFLIACSVITILAFAQASLKRKTINELIHKIEFERYHLEKANVNTNKLQAEIGALTQITKSMEEDRITHLMGWHVFVRQLQKKLQEGERYRLTLALLLIKLKDLAKITDALGYEVGERLLKEAAERITSNIRDVDNVARFNENTFVVLLSQITKPESAVIVAQRIIQALKQGFDTVDRVVYVESSIGISTYPADSKNADALIQAANLALEDALESGAYNYQFYQADMHLRSKREIALQMALAEGLASSDFKVYYHPILDTATSKISCMDAALYWQHGRPGELNPAEVFDYANKHHKSNIISEWLLEKSCKDYILWREQEHNPKLIGLPLFINQLEQSNFVYRISHILQKNEFNPNCLMLEIKGSLQKISFDILDKSFNMLKYLNINLCVSDFGQETSHLNFIKDIEIDYIKLDPRLISDIVNNRRTTALIESIVLIMEKLAISLIVTGVTTEAQYNILKKLGVCYMQGPFIAKPIEANEMRKKIVEYTV